MLKLGIFDTAEDEGAAPTVPPSLITRALGDLVMERSASGSFGYVVEQLCSALVGDTPRLANAYVDRLIDCGVSVEAIYDTYIPRAAARLGEMWLDDSLGFSAVTLGMTRLTELFRRMRPNFLKDAPTYVPGGFGRSALFALAPGESHSLGVVMAADHFQRRGWSVQVELKADAAELVRIARAQPFDVIGFSAGSRRMVPKIRAAVDRLRDVAAPTTRYVLGGALTRLQEDAAWETGVDFAVTDPGEALDALEEGSYSFQSS